MYDCDSGGSASNISRKGDMNGFDVWGMVVIAFGFIASRDASNHRKMGLSIPEKEPKWGYVGPALLYGIPLIIFSEIDWFAWCWAFSPIALLYYQTNKGDKD